MPTIKHRISLTPSPDVYALISELATLEGRSRSAVVCDVLDAALVPLQSVRDVLLRASSIKAEELAALEAKLEQVQAEVLPVMNNLMELISGGSKRGTNLDLFEDSDGINRGAPEAATDAAYPHLLIGGSVFTKVLNIKDSHDLSPGGATNEV